MDVDAEHRSMTKQLHQAPSTRLRSLLPPDSSSIYLCSFATLPFLGSQPRSPQLPSHMHVAVSKPRQYCKILYHNFAKAAVQSSPGFLLHPALLLLGERMGFVLQRGSTSDGRATFLAQYIPNASQPSKLALFR